MKAEYISHMGDDLSVVNAARVSFSKESGWVYPHPSTSGPGEKDLSSKDKKLISYLAKHKHWTPFAHTAITLRMQAPVPIRTQCFKHKVGFVENEESRRYISTIPALYDIGEVRSSHENKKQGSGDVHPKSEYWRWRYFDVCREAYDVYVNAIDDGVCPEQARFMLPQGVEVQWVWTGSLESYARFYRQRTDPHAQKEIQDLAKMVGEIIQPLYPISWEVLTNE